MGSLQFASFNDTFVHVTDLSGKETIARVTGELTSVDMFLHESHDASQQVA